MSGEDIDGAPSGEAVSVDWLPRHHDNLREHYELACQVREWFKEAVETSRAAVPPIGACGSVVTSLLTVKHYQHYHKPIEGSSSTGEVMADLLSPAALLSV